jgi:hypothetical protein
MVLACDFRGCFLTPTLPFALLPMIFRFRLSIRSIMMLPMFFLLNTMLPSNSVAEDTTIIDRPWVIDCAKNGLAESVVPLPAEGTILHQLLYCVVDSALWNEDSQDVPPEFETGNWCFDPYLLTRSCKANDLDPYEYLFKCLGANNIPGLASFPIRYETSQAVGNVSSDPFAEDIIYVEPLIGAACTLLDGIRSPWGVECLFAYFQSLSAAPSAAPSPFPSVAPSQIPSDYPSESPTLAPSSFPSIIPSDMPSSSPTIAPSDMPSESAPRYPPIVVQIQILLKFVLKNMNISLPPPPGFVHALATGLNSILVASVEGHQTVEIVHVDYVDGTKDISIILRATGRRECVECLASDLTKEIESGYEAALKAAGLSGSLVQQIEFHGFISDVPSLMSVNVDPESIESIVSINRNKAVDNPESVSSSSNLAVASSLLIGCAASLWSGVM